MTPSLLERQGELPRSIPLFRHVPHRRPFDWATWQPSVVRSAADLPPYLIFGDLDASSFQWSAAGWQARWQGTEHDTHFDVTYRAAEQRYELRQTWRGIDGGFSCYPARIPLPKLILQTLCMAFPRGWDKAAKEHLEQAYQVTILEPSNGSCTVAGMPDGALRTIAIPVATKDLRPIRDWLRDAISAAHARYPVFAEAKLTFQAINHLEGKAPSWTTDQAVVFGQSVEETGLIPYGLPVKETAADGSSAWTLRRELYVLYIGLPFAGLTDFLARTATTNGPIRTRLDPELRIELRPFVGPVAFELRTKSMACWDPARTTRSFWQFAGDDDRAVASGPATSQRAEAEPECRLQAAEAISAELSRAIAPILSGVREKDRHLH